MLNNPIDKLNELGFAFRNPKAVRDISIEFLSSVQAAEEWTRDVRILMHPNGFLKISLDLQKGKTFRLHFWPRADPAFSDVHSHAAEFHSLILAGGYRERLFTANPPRDASSQAFVAYRYPSGHGKEQEQSVLLGGCELALVCERYYGLNDRLLRLPTQLHAVKASAKTVTASLWHTARANYSIVYKADQAKFSPIHQQDTAARFAFYIEQAIHSMRRAATTGKSSDQSCEP